ncbi:hypothetical protein HDU83_006675 [Entophlyctis luteolus]|nr:hypothetical protein HDU83_006675 [Entophlyctis luteolus]
MNRASAELPGSQLHLVEQRTMHHRRQHCAEDSETDLAAQAEAHLRSALRLRAALMSAPETRETASAAEQTAAVVDMTIGALSVFLTSLSLRRRRVALPPPPHHQRTLPDLPRELLELVCAWIPPREAMRLRRLSRSFNAALTSTHFARISIARHDDRDAATARASELDNIWFHLPPAFQCVYADIRLAGRDSIEWRLKPRAAAAYMIPAAISRIGASLVTLDLGYCGLSGIIPRSLYTLTRLEELKLHENRLSGELHEDIGNLVCLRVLNLHSNCLEGEIPASLSNLSCLTYLNLGHNNFCGRIPRELGSLKELQQLYLSSNRLTGSLPGEFQFLSKLQYLFLTRNFLEIFDAPLSWWPEMVAMV